MTMNVNELAEWIHDVSTGHGFEEPSRDNLPEKLMLSVSELSEALEEHRDGKIGVYYEYTRDQRHMSVEHPTEIEQDSDGSWYWKDVEVDVTDFLNDWVRRVEGQMSVPANYYQRDDRWYTMERQRFAYDPNEWAAKGALDKKPEGALVEIADSVIRNLHMMHSLINQEGLDTTPYDVIFDKVAYNESRPMKHGRAY